MDHTSDVLLAAMRARLGYGYDEIAKGVPCPAPGSADAAPACAPAPTPADAPAASAGQPAPAERCSSLSAADRTAQDPTAVCAEVPAVQHAAPDAAALVSLQRPGPQQDSAAMPTAADAAAMQPADNAQSPSQVPASAQPSCSAARGTPPVDVQHSSTLEKQLRSPAADSLLGPLQPLQQAELPAACELPPKQGTMAGQQQDRQLTKATPAAAARPSAVVMPATAVQVAAAKPAVATPTTGLPALSDELLTGPPAADAAVSTGVRQVAAGSEPATALDPPGAVQFTNCACMLTAAALVPETTVASDSATQRRMSARRPDVRGAAS